MKTLIIKNDRISQEVMPHGWGNGYVAIPKESILYGYKYQDLNEIEDISVHGGLTFSDYAKTLIHGNSEINPDDWVVGFDTCHFGDNLQKWTKQNVQIEADNLLSQLQKLETKIKV